MAPVSQKVQLTIQAKELKSFSRFSKNADAYAVVTLTSGDGILGRTEVINSLSPVWTKTFHIQYKIGIPNHFNITIFDSASTISSTDNNHKQMGSAMFEVGEILGHRGVKAKSLKRGGVLIVRINKAPQQNSGQLVVAFQGVQLRPNERSRPDPFFELSRREDNGVGGDNEEKDGWLTVYRSQEIINNVDPIWEPAVVDLDRLCDGDHRRPILVSLYDFEKNGKHKRMGWFETNVNALIMNKVQGKRRASITTFVLTKEKGGKEKNYGKVVVSDAYIQTDKAVSSKNSSTKFDENEMCLNITLRAKNFTKSADHPYFEFSRMIKKGTTRMTVYRSSHLKECISSDPQWKMVSIPMVKLCDQNENMPITLSVCYYKNCKEGRVLGQCDTTVQELLEVVSGNNPNEVDKLIPVTSSKKTVGKIQVMQATVDKPANLKANEINNERAVLSSHTLTELNGDDDDSSSTSNSQNSTPSLPTPTFIDYLAGGCELQLCIAIDFSSSNGPYQSPSSYHYTRPDNGLNDYERAILEVASIISKYDLDNEYPLWGFGAKIRGNQLNCFQLGSKPQANGLKDVIHTYRCFFDYSFTMSEKAIATEVIENAAKYATWEAKHKPGCNGQTYTILLILTDGDLQNIAATKSAIFRASLTPLSIVIIGIGDGDFSDMQLLDDFVEGTNKHTRDITQFVQFNAHRKTRHDLTAAVFEEIPEQVVEYFQKHGIEPNPPLDANVSDEYLEPEQFDEDDFMLELEKSGRSLKLSDESSRGFEEQLSRRNLKYERAVAGIEDDERDRRDDGIFGSIFKKWCVAGCTTGNFLQNI